MRNLLTARRWVLQNKLELITGIPVQNQSISVYASEDAPEPVITLSDDSKPLGFYGVRDWQVLKVRLLVPAVPLMMSQHRPL